jgi:hypothetical protein
VSVCPKKGSDPSTSACYVGGGGLRSDAEQAEVGQGRSSEEAQGVCVSVPWARNAWYCALLLFLTSAEEWQPRTAHRQVPDLLPDTDEAKARYKVRDPRRPCCVALRQRPTSRVAQGRPEPLSAPNHCNTCDDVCAGVPYQVCCRVRREATDARQEGLQHERALQSFDSVKNGHYKPATALLRQVARIPKEVMHIQERKMCERDVIVYVLSHVAAVENKTRSFVSLLSPLACRRNTLKRDGPRRVSDSRGSQEEVDEHGYARGVLAEDYPTDEYFHEYDDDDYSTVAPSDSAASEFLAQDFDSAEGDLHLSALVRASLLQYKYSASRNKMLNSSMYKITRTGNSLTLSVEPI